MALTSVKQRHKWELAKRGLESHLDIIIIDIDVVVLRNPLNFLFDLPYCDLSAYPENLPAQVLRSYENRFSHHERVRPCCLLSLVHAVTYDPTYTCRMFRTMVMKATFGSILDFCFFVTRQSQ